MAPTKSEVWKHFSKESNSTVKCGLCGKLLKCSNNTSNMFQHLHLKHPKDAENLKAQFKNGDEGENRNTEKATTSQQTRSGIAESPSTSNNITSSLRQPVLKTCLSNVQSYASGGSKHQKLTQSIMEMIVTDNLPFSHVEGKGFRKFMKIICPLYAVPCRNTVKAYMEKTYETEAKNFKTKLSEIPNMCLTTDIWTDTEMNSMLGVTVHGLFGSNQFSGTIGVFKLTEAHTAVHISEILEESLLEFSINKENVMAIVTDNGANIVKAIHDTFGKRRHIPCFAHTLNLVCENALNTPEVADVISKCKAIVTWFKRSVKANDDLRRLQSRAGIPQGKMLKPIMDVKTRWNSTYYMLDRFLKLISYISQILLNYYDAPPMITTKNKEEIEELVQLLRPLEAMTSQISGEKYATLSHIIPLTHCGRLQIHKMHCVCPVANKVKETILAQFNRRFGEIEHSFLVAASTLLDPRFKKIHFQDPLAVSKVMRHLRKEMDEIPTEDSIGSSSEASSTGELEFDLWAPHKNLAHKRRRKDDESTQDELSFYLNAPVLELKRNVPDAWEEMKSVYPKLYIIAQKYCFLVGTSVPAERLFSKAGATATEKRNRLTTKRLSKLLFLNSVFNNTQ